MLTAPPEVMQALEKSLQHFYLGSLKIESVTIPPSQLLSYRQAEGILLWGLEAFMFSGGLGEQRGLLGDYQKHLK